MSIRLPNTLRDAGEKHFAATLADELKLLPTGSLPLHLATTQGGMVDDSDIAVSVLNSHTSETEVRCKITVFFDELVSGCNCADDPSPDHTATPSSCQLLVTIDRVATTATFTVLDKE